jgi:hypothetical protein
MAITISDQQLQELETRRRPAVIVRDRRKKKGYAVLPEAIYDQARPVIEFVAAKVGDAANETDAWTEEKNARRVALVNKKYDSRLSAAEERDLATLQDEVCRHQERLAPLNNRALELILEALEQRASSAARRKL